MSFEPLQSMRQSSFGSEPETVPKGIPSPARAFPPPFPPPPPVANGSSAFHDEPSRSPSPSPAEVTDIAPVELVAELVAKSVAEPAVQPEPVAPPVRPPSGFAPPAAPPAAPVAPLPAEKVAEEMWGRPPLTFLERASVVATRAARALIAVANAPRPGSPPPSPRQRAAVVWTVAGVTGLIIVLAIIAATRHSAKKAAVVPPAPPPVASAASAAPPAPPAPPPVPPAPPTVAQEPSSPPPAEAGPFKAVTARRALDVTSREVAKCRKGKTWGTAFATVTFANDGTVSHVDVGAPFRGTPSGACVADGLSAATIPPFGGAQGTVVYRFFVGIKRAPE